MTSPARQKLDRLRTKPPFLTPPGRRVSADNPDTVLSHGRTGLIVLPEREKDQETDPAPVAFSLLKQELSVRLTRSNARRSGKGHEKAPHRLGAVP